MTCSTLRRYRTSASRAIVLAALLACAQDPTTPPGVLDITVRSAQIADVVPQTLTVNATVANSGPAISTGRCADPQVALLALNGTTWTEIASNGLTSLVGCRSGSSIARGEPLELRLDFVRSGGGIFAAPGQYRLQLRVPGGYVLSQAFEVASK